MAEEEAQAEEAQAQEAQAEEEAEQKAAEEEEAQLEEDEQRDPGSTMIASWGFNREEELLEVAFQNGHEESYPCDPATWAEATGTTSAGKFMHEHFL